MPRELIPSLIIACRLALAISVAVFSYRVGMALAGRPAIFLHPKVLTDVIIGGYTGLLLLWLAVEAVGELYQVGKRLTAAAK